MLFNLISKFKPGAQKGNKPNAPKRFLASKEYASKFKVSWRKVYDTCKVDLPCPFSYGQLTADFGKTLCATFPELGMLEVPDGQLVGTHGWVVGKEAYWLPEHSWHGLDISNINVPKNLSIPEKVKGVVLNLASDWSSNNYGHFLLDSLSRYHLFRQAGYCIDTVDKVYLPFSNSAVAKKFSSQLGIPSEKCLFTPFPTNYRLQADILLAPSFPGIKRNYPAWVAKFLNQNLLPDTTNKKRRLYVTRSGGTRKVENEASVREILTKQGFEIYNPSEHPNPIQDFAEASIVVGAHGAGLTDIVFCQPGTQVLELIPSDHIYPYFFSIAQASNLRYGYILCPSLGKREAGTFDPSPFDFRVPELELQSALEIILSSEDILAC